MQIKIKGIQLTVEIPQLEELMERINEMALDVKSILKKEKQLMADFAELKAKVETATAKIDALNVALDGYRELVGTMKVELEALKSGQVLAPAVQAKVDEMATLLDTETAKIDETYNENFPPVEPPPDQV
jgi:chromosome segregation ATPase